MNVYTRVVMQGGAVRVTCRVPKDVRNTGILFGVEGVAESGYDLDGENARITHERLVDHMDCGAGKVFCELTYRENGERKKRRVTTTVKVAGCDVNEDTGAVEPFPS